MSFSASRIPPIGTVLESRIGCAVWVWITCVLQAQFPPSAGWLQSGFSLPDASPNCRSGWQVLGISGWRSRDRARLRGAPDVLVVPLLPWAYFCNTKKRDSEEEQDGQF